MKKSRRKQLAVRPSGGEEPTSPVSPGRRGGQGWWVFAAAGLVVLAGFLISRQRPPSVTPPVARSVGPATTTNLAQAVTPGAGITESAVADPGNGTPDMASLLTGPRDDAGDSSGKVAAGGPTAAQLVWHGLTEPQRQQRALADLQSNIRKADYAGADSCKECHAENFNEWSHHPHRWMNALATDEIVKGDFSDGRPMDYLGGQVHFSRDGTNRFMRFVRGETNRSYRVTRTIGSRFTQYYVGLLTDGPEDADHPGRSVEHVLAIGWWIDREEWIPAVHIDAEGPDGTRWDPFAKASDIPYDTSCAVCHTTPTMGDWMLNPNGVLRMGYYSPAPVLFDVRQHLVAERPDLAATTFNDAPVTARKKLDLIRAVRDQNAVEHAVNLGISCEACHLGSREHVQASDRNKSALLPHFFPVSSNVVATTDRPGWLYRRNPESINFVCARCHTGKRPYFASGAATWNSVEYSDAENGYCYVRKSQRHPELEILACTACHDPHQPTGPVWSKSPDEDDAACLKCHSSYAPAEARFRHTRHAHGTEGARCLNCHMPRVNEGLQSVVRTHAISSPAAPAMIEANQPNACNLCHLDQSIDWTITWLSRWYKLDRFRSYDLKKIAANYPDRTGPVGLGWLRSPHEPTRLVAVDAFARADAKWALPQVVNALDDPYLLNRQFARIALERWLGVRLEDHGYRFYLTPEERREPVARVKAALLTPNPVNSGL